VLLLMCAVIKLSYIPQTEMVLMNVVMELSRSHSSQFFRYQFLAWISFGEWMLKNLCNLIRWAWYRSATDCHRQTWWWSNVVVVHWSWL